MARKQSLESWIAEVLTDMPDGKMCSGIGLVHVVGFSSEKELHSIKMNSGKQWTAKELAEIFDHKASTYCQDLTGVQMFTLHVFYGDSTTPGASLPFRKNGDHNYEGTGLTEAPTGQGLVQQSMRHSEAAVQMAFRAMSEANQLLMEHAKQCSAENLLLRKENFDAWQVVKEIGTKDREAKHALRMEQIRAERNSALWQEWMRFGPALINNILGVEIFPQATEDTALVETIISSLTKDQMEKLASALPPKLLGPLAARAEKYLKQRKEREATDLAALEDEDPIAELTEGGESPNGATHAH
jgi:hypothetical protein